MKPKLLVLELWGLGDLMIATPFLRAAAEKFTVTMVAKPFAQELQPRFWPGVRLVPFNAPWTAFRAKYHFWNWPWDEMRRLQKQLVLERFDHGLSARWDPRDHLLLKLSGARDRLGFPRLQSRCLLTRPQIQPGPLAHRSEFWRVAGKALGLEIAPREELLLPPRSPSPMVLIHSGARLPVRVWPLENFREIAARLRQKKISVQVVCDANQLGWWQSQGESAICPRNVTELQVLADQAGSFVGNCSGPGHLAAICGVPTFTIYGSSLPEWFIPMHPAAETFEGHACPYKPCSDYCRYAKPFCLSKVTVAEVWPRLERFVDRNLPADREPGT